MSKSSPTRNLWLLSGLNKGISASLGFGSSVFVARFLGVDLRGEYAYVTQVSTIAALVLNLGVGQSYSYFFRKNNGDVYRNIIPIYVWQFIVYSSAAVSLSVVSGLKGTTALICILTPAAVVFSQMSSTLAVENFVHKVTLHICAAIIKFTVFGCLLAASDALSNHLVWAVICTAGVDLIIAVAALIISGKLSSIFRLDFCFLVTVLKYSWALMLLSLLITLNYSVDVVILRILSDSRDLGLYAIAIGIVTYSWFLPDVFKDVLIFRTARSDSTDAINLSIKVSASVITIVIVAFVLVGKPLLRIFYGEAFVGSFTVTIILLSGGISMVPFKTISVLLTAQGKRMINLVTLSFSVVANIIANIVLIPSLGMYGAAWSSVISYSIAGIALLLYYCRCEKQTLRQVLLLSRDDFRRLATALKGKLAR